MKDLRSFYMKDAWDPTKLARYARTQLADVDYDTLVGTGLSGAIVVPELARRLKKHALIVRKPDDGSHSSSPVEGVLGERWVFVDDFVASGATRQRVTDAVDEAAGDTPTRYVGQLMYANHDPSRGFQPAR